jgi:iron complex outermembrane recepter protein
MTNRKPLLRRTGALASAIGAIMTGAAWSNVAGAQETEARSTLDEITITGTRIRRDDFSSPTPTTVVDNEYMQNLGLVNLGDAMLQMPSNIGTNQPSTTGNANFFVGSTLANLRGLNPFFGSRTLTLVDTRRHVPTNQGDGVDLNFVPTVLIDRMEVVTGGASAAYGSGAISGVTNILLDRRLDGARVELDFGRSGEGDGDDTHFGAAFGTPVGGRGHFVIGGEYQDSDGIYGCQTARSWCSRQVGIFQNPNFPADGRAQYLITEGLQEAWRSTSGVFYLHNPGAPSTDPVNARLSEDGTSLVPWNPGIVEGGGAAANAIGGDGEPLYLRTTLRSQVDRRVLYGNFDYEINDALNMSVEASWGNVESLNPNTSLTADNFCIRADNAFVQPEITGSTELLDFVTANSGQYGGCIFGQEGVPIRKHLYNQVDTNNNTSTDLARFAVGFDGQFGASTWTWDAYYQWGRSERMQRVNDNRHLNRFGFGVDAILDPRPESPTFGEPVCRYDVDGSMPTAVQPFFSVLGAQFANPDLATGCVPINLLGSNTMTQEMIDFGFGFLREDTTVKQQVVAFTASGEVADGFGAGAIRAAAGVELRTESIANIAAEELPDYERLDFLIQYGESFSGDVDVWEVFGEIDVPITDRFGLNAAARQSRYTHTGKAGTTGEKSDHDITTWKLAGAWQPIDLMNLRFSASKDIRAPNFRELYYGQIFTQGGLFGFLNNTWTGNALDPAAWTLAGNTNLKPEEAETYTVGFVFTPPNRNFRIAADYYEISIEDAITPAQINLVRDACFEGDQSFCDFITGVTTPWQDPSVDDAGNATGGQDSIPCPATCFIDVVTIRAEAFNFRSYEVRGADLTTDWFRDVGDGTVNVRLIASRVFDQIIQPSASPALANLTQDIAGTTGNTLGFLQDWSPSAGWLGNLVATYSRGPFAVTGQARYTHSGRNDVNRIGPDDPRFPLHSTTAGLTPLTINNNRVPSHTIFNLSGSYNFALAGGQTLQLWGTVNNVFDKDPPMTGGGFGGTNAIFFDTIGRAYRAGVRMRF